MAFACRLTIGSILAAMLILVLKSGIAAANVVYVRADGTGQVTSIHEGIEAASYGDTVRVGAGIYAEPDLILKSRMRLENEEGAEPIVTGSGGPFEIHMANGSFLIGFTILEVQIFCNQMTAEIIGNHIEGSSSFAMLYIGQSHARVEGNTLIAHPGGNRCIMVGSASPEIVGNFIIMESNSTGYAIDISYGNPWAYSETIVRDNVVLGGIKVDHTRDDQPPIIIENNLVQNRNGYGSCFNVAHCSAALRIHNNTILSGGIYLQGETRADIAYNVIVDFVGSGGAVRATNNCFPSLRNNLFFGNNRDFSGFYDQTTLESNIYGNPEFCDPGAEIYTVAAGSPCLPDNNPFRRMIGAYGVGCDVAPADITLRADGAGDYTTIQAAANAVGTDESAVIELTDGVYRGHGNRDVNFANKHISIRSISGNRDSCIIDCQGSLEFPHRAFDVENTYDHAGGLELVNLSVINGHGEDGGGAIAVRGSLTIRGCEIRECTAGPAGSRGGAVSGNGGLVPTYLLLDTTIEGCSASDGGAVSVVGMTDMLMANCTVFANNSNTGALHLQDGVKAKVVNTIISHSLTGPGYGENGTGVVAGFAGTNIFGNEGGDWIGEIADFLGVDCNFTADPIFCGPVSCGELGANLRLAGDSPCLPGNSGCGELVGALGMGCEAPAVSVHPGDADNNGIVNEFDIIPLGVPFLSEGSPRGCYPYEWEGQSGYAWLVDGANYADTDGNGLVDEQDLFAIGLNWGKAHSQGSNSFEMDLESLIIDSRLWAEQLGD